MASTATISAVTSAVAANNASVSAATAAVSNATISAGSFTVTSGSIYTSNLSFQQPPELHMKGDNPRIITDKGEIDLDQLLDIVKRAEAILCVVKADMERLDRYPALQEAYDHYRIIDALCRGDEDDG